MISIVTFFQNLSSIVQTLIGTLFAFLLAVIGSLLVLLFKKNMSNKWQAFLQALACGIMICSSIFSLILPAIEYSTNMPVKFIILPLVFVCGVLCVWSISLFFKSKKTTTNFSLISSITLHNIPEGMCIGICFAMATDFKMISLTSAILFAIAIAIQNLPEGTAVSSALLVGGNSKAHSVFWGIVTSFVEVIFGVLACILAQFTSSLLPYILALAGGMMFYVSIFELSFEAQTKSKTLAMLGFAFGFFIMMLIELL